MKLNCPNCQAQIHASDGQSAVCADCGARTPGEPPIRTNEAEGTGALGDPSDTERERTSTAFDISDTTVPEIPKSSPVGPIVIVAVGLLLALIGAYFAR